MEPSFYSPKGNKNIQIHSNAQIAFFYFWAARRYAYPQTQLYLFF